MYYPTQVIVEKCLQRVFSGLSLGCLSPSVQTLGYVPQFHSNPGMFGTLPVTVPSITGVDIPILVEDDYPINGTVAIIAQDPLRNPSGPLTPFNPYNNPIVGTPFAYHYNSTVYPMTNVYRHVINGLLNRGYRVYITDIWKSWDPNNMTRIGKWSNKNPHKICLDEELDLIKPDIVVLMGNVAQSKYKIINYAAKKVVSVPHPSNASNGTWAIMGVSANPQAKANYILSQI